MRYPLKELFENIDLYKVTKFFFWKGVTYYLEVRIHKYGTRSKGNENDNIEFIHKKHFQT